MNARKFAFLANVNLFFSNIIKYKASGLLKWVQASDTYSTSILMSYPSDTGTCGKKESESCNVGAF